MPYMRPDSRARRTIWQMACERLETSFTSVALVVRFRLPCARYRIGLVG